MKPVRVAIDGPAASGKTTTAKRLAARLGYRYLDSGAMYRALALKVLAAGVNPDDLEGVLRILSGVSIAYDEDGVVRLDGTPETIRLREPRVSDASSRLSVHAPVREWINERLRAEAAGGAVVMEGRDIGTVVLPDAEVKVFLDARLDIRSRRRLSDLTAGGVDQSLADVEDELRARDDRDRRRPVAPLKAAPDAVRIDGSEMSFDEQVSVVEALVREKSR